MRVSRDSPGCSALGQPGTSFWADHLDLVVERCGGLDELQLILEIFDPAAGLGPAIGLIALEADGTSGVDQGLAAPLVQGRTVDRELGDQVLDGLAGQHPFTGLATELTRVAKWHVHLLVGHGQILTKAVHWMGVSPLCSPNGIRTRTLRIK